jgi:hypothetical protein
MAQTQLPDRQILIDSEPKLDGDNRETLHIDFLIDFARYPDYRKIKADSKTIFLEKTLSTDDEVTRCLEDSVRITLKYARTYFNILYHAYYHRRLTSLLVLPARRCGETPEEFSSFIDVRNGLLPI